jgi:hypothetical protein
LPKIGRLGSHNRPVHLYECSFAFVDLIGKPVIVCSPDNSKQLERVIVG